MNSKEMNRLQEHFDRYFEQDDCLVLHPMMDFTCYHIDVLLYRPSAKYPFWKLATMGASDYKMPVKKPLISDRNEYIMFVDPGENLEDAEVVNWYHRQLMEIALYAPQNNTYITYAHSFEWQDDGEEMVGAFLEMPQVIENPGVLRCKLGMLKTAACLQVVLLNKEELGKLMEMEPQAFSEFLYPDEGEACHFLCERARTEKF